MRAALHAVVVASLPAFASSLPLALNVTSINVTDHAYKPPPGAFNNFRLDCSDPPGSTTSYRFCSGIPFRYYCNYFGGLANSGRLNHFCDEACHCVNTCPIKFQNRWGVIGCSGFAKVEDHDSNKTAEGQIAEPVENLELEGSKAPSVHDKRTSDTGLSASMTGNVDWFSQSWRTMPLT